jgi:hypothetical protein
MSESRPTRKDKEASAKSGPVVGVAWYRKEDWPKLLAVSADRDNLEDTFDEWCRGAQQLLLRLVSEGVEARKVDVELDNLIAWCRNEHRPLDGAARANYVSVLLSKAAGGRGPAAE